MPHHLTGLVTAICAAMLAASCGGATMTEVTVPTAPSGVRCQTTVSSPPQTFPAAGARVSLTVVASRECTWTSSSETSWAQVSPTSGQGEASLTVTVGANPEARARSGAVIVNEFRLSLAQEAVPCRFELSGSSARMSHVGGRTGVRVSTLDGCGWRASSPAEWVRIPTDSGTGSGTVDLEVSPNDGSERSVTVLIAEQPFTMSQDSAQPTPTPTPPPNGTTCVFTIDDDSRSFGAQGGEGSIQVITLPGCAWTGSANAEWISITSGGSGSGAGRVQYRVAPNGSTGERSATIAAAGRTHTVRQSGLQPPRVDLQGRASNVSGICPIVTFTVSGRSVFTDPITRFTGEGCTTLRNGVQVKVEGRLLPDGLVRATKVEVEDDD